MTVEEIMARKAEIKNEVEAEGADLNALEEEVRNLNAELDNIKETAEKRQAVRDAVTMGEGKVTEKIETEERKMTLEEVRSSKEYINAFANYIKTGRDDECRALLSENVTGGVLPVPTVIEGRIREAWQRSRIMELVRKTYIRGNLKIGFELSATGAVVHTEGAAAPDEETLTFGVVTMVPQSIKKWITISDEALDLGGEEFLDYIYDELTYQIAKKAEDELIALIDAAATTASATGVGVPVVTASTISLGTIAEAIANLADNAANPVIVMNKLTYAAFKAVQYGANFAADPFEGLTVHFNNTLPAFSAASTGDTYAIVGDFGVGAHANFPNGDEIRITYDNLSRAEQDVVKLVGREYVALGLVSNNAFVKIQK